MNKNTNYRRTNTKGRPENYNTTLMINECIQYKVEGKPTRVVIDIMKRKYGISEVRVGQLLTEAYKELNKYAKQNKQEMIDLNIARYEHIYGKALAKDDLKTAKDTLKEQETLLKLRDEEKPNNQLTLNQNTINLNQLSMNDLKELLSNNNNE